MFKKTSLLLLLAILLLSPLSFLRADGGMIPYYEPDYKDIYEPSQTALIVYNEGVEDLYIKAGYEGETNKFVWIVPTPSYPEAEIAPYDIFDELSIYTRNERSEQKTEDLDGVAGNFGEGEQNVIVHSQEQVGIYEVTVLSATGVDGLYAWLKENNYPVEENVKEVLDWYIDKEWYFTVMKIDPSGILDQIISDFDKEADVKITKDNLAEELVNYYMNGIFVEKNFIKFQKAMDYLLKLSPKDYESYDDFNDMKNWSKEKFQEEISNFDFSEEDLLENKIKATTDIQNWIYYLDYENNLENTIADFNKEIGNKEINKDNFSKELATYYAESIRNKNFIQFQKSIDYLLMLISYNNSSYDDISDIKNWSEEKFIEEVGSKNFSKEELLDGIEEMKSEIDSWISDSFPENINKYSDYIEPIKISFKSNSIVYPLKISQISTRVPENFKESPKTNEVLLYVLSDNQVKAPEFNLEFNKEIDKTELDSFEEDLYSDQNLNSLKSIIGDKIYYLTKLRRDFAKDEMDDDLYLIEGEIQDDGKVDVLLFKGDGCPHCVDAEKFLDDVKNNFEDINLKEYEIYNNSENKELYNNMAKKFDLGSSGVPLIVIGDDYVMGFGDEEVSGKKIIEKINGETTKSLIESYQAEDAYLKAKNSIFGSALSDRLKGKIVIKVEDDGKAYYINPTTKYSHYLGRPADAFSVMRNQGVGIKDVDIANIPVALSNLTGDDADGDGLPDKFEDAIGTDANNPDTDGDGYSDKQELEGNYDPNNDGGAKLEIDNGFSEKQKGRILLQVENNGEAWYINPEDGKRYFLGRPADAFQVMRNLGLGISNEDFGKL